MLHEGISLLSSETTTPPDTLQAEILSASPSSYRENPVFQVHLAAGSTLNAVSVDIERQIYRALYKQCRGRFDKMAGILLGDENAHRKVRLRFNQIGLRVRDLRETLLD
jgi:hypothetical protein